MPVTLSTCSGRTVSVSIGAVSLPATADIEATQTPGPFRRWFAISFTLVAGLILSLVAFGVVHHVEQQRLKADFDAMVEVQVSTTTVARRSYAECLYTLRNLFAASDSVKREEFQVVAGDLRRRHPGIHSLKWLPHVSQAQRPSMEAAAGSEVTPNWRINDGNVPPGGEPVASGSRDEYLPTLFVEPSASPDGDLGVDHLLGPHRETVLAALESGDIVATPRTLLRGGNREEFGWLLYLPVHAYGNIRTPSDRPPALRGMVVGAFRFSDLVAKGIPSQSGSLEIVLTDETYGNNDPYILNVLNGEWRPVPPPHPSEFKGPFVERRELHDFGRRWTLHARPSASWLASKQTGLPHVVLVFGIWLTCVLATSMHGTRRRSETIASLVDTRTEQLRRTQDKLREDVRRRRQSEERYRAFVEQSTEAIWRFEMTTPMPLAWPKDRQVKHLLEHARMAECNDACARMYGYDKASEMLGKALGELMPIEDPANVAHLEEYIGHGFRMVGSESHEVDRHGQSHTFINNIIGIVDDGCLVRSWGTQRDITEQRRMEEARAADAQRLKIALAAANLGLWEWDRATDVVKWSEEMHRMFLLPEGAHQGTYESYLAYVHPDDRERVNQTFDSALRYGHEFEMEYRILRSDGAQRWIYMRGDVRKDGTRVRGMVGAAIDTTAKKHEEEERSRIDGRLQETQKLESLGILAGGIAHDFNNLLTGILGNASLGRLDLPPSSPVHQSLGQIELAAQRAAELCKQMLAYSGKGRFIVQLLNLTHLVDEAAPLLQISVSKNAVLKFRLSRELPAISGDATQLRQILMNLVINASDAIEARSGVIEISTSTMKIDRDYLSGTHLAPILPDGEYICLEVSDNGSGMSAETQRRIFDPFFTTKFTGRGLGLAAVLGIVRGHRGAIKVYSESGKGTTFKLLLPKADGSAESIDAERADSKLWRGSGIVLVVDDELTVRQVATRMLRVFGFEVLTASNGREALGIFRENHDVVAVLLDLTMPQLDGAQTFTELRRISPNVRVVLMSGFNEVEAVNRFAGKGLAGFLQKPFKAETLGHKLRGVISSTPPVVDAVEDSP